MTQYCNEGNCLPEDNMNWVDIETGKSHFYKVEGFSVAPGNNFMDLQQFMGGCGNYENDSFKKLAIDSGLQFKSINVSFIYLSDPYPQSEPIRKFDHSAVLNQHAHYYIKIHTNFIKFIMLKFFTVLYPFYVELIF
jgi:hypothetical protein